MNWQEEAREMFRALVFIQIKEAEPSGVSLTDIHEKASGGYRDGYGTKTQMHNELQAMVEEGILFLDESKGKDIYRVVSGAESKFPNMTGPAFDR